MAIDENPAKVTESASVTPPKSAPQNLAEIKNDLNESKSHETEERGGNSTEKVASSSSEAVSNAAPAKGNEHIESEIEQAFAAYEDKDGNK